MSGLRAGVIWIAALTATSRWGRAWARFAGSWSITWMILLLLTTPLWSPRLIFNPSSVSISVYTVQVQRSYPLLQWWRDHAPEVARDWVQPPIVSYRETVRPLATGQPVCTDANTFRHQGRGEFGQWTIDAWAARCMNEPHTWEACWRVYLLDLIPTRRMCLEAVVFHAAAGAGQ